MKRVGNLEEELLSIKKLELAHKRAKKNKTKQKKAIKEFEKNFDILSSKIINSIKNETFKSSKYRFRTIEDKGKEREIAILPYYPDRIVHWLVMNVTQKVFERTHIRNTHAAIKGKGVQSAVKWLNKDIKKNPNLKWCLKIDIEKYFPNIDKEVLKNLNRKVLKDKKTLWLLDTIIDDYPKSGIPIGNYTSQVFGNFYLSYFDHYVKEVLKAKVYHRYMDDMVMLFKTKREADRALSDIRIYLKRELKLNIKDNYQVFRVSDRGVDFAGYKNYGYKITMRNKNKRNVIRCANNIKRLKIKYGDQYKLCSLNRGRAASYNGITMRCTSDKIKGLAKGMM